jgi:hypothetical protein
MYSCTLPLILTLDGVGGQCHAPAALPREKSVTHCVGGWVGHSGQVQKISPPTGVESQDRTTGSELLYLLC